jgi:hypothetical protein
MDTEQLTGHMFQLICDLVHEHGSQLGEDEWRDIFAEVLANAYAGETPDDWEPGLPV